jgi:hypothetical protein
MAVWMGGTYNFIKRAFADLRRKNMAINYDDRGWPVTPRPKRTETRLHVRHRPDDAMLRDVAELWREFGTGMVAKYYNVSTRTAHAWLDKARDKGVLSRDEFRAGLGPMSDAKLVDRLHQLHSEAERRGLDLLWKKLI